MPKYRIHSGPVFFETQTVKSLSAVMETAQHVLSQFKNLSFYWSAIVNTALSCIVLSILTLNNIVTLKSGLEVTQDLSNCHAPDCQELT